MTFIDISQLATKDAPSWSGKCGFETKVIMDYPQGLCVQKLTIHGSLGTHIDTPAHFFEGAKAADGIDLKELCVPLVVVDAIEGVWRTKELAKKEIPKGSFVLFRSGWWKKWNDPEAYRGLGLDGKMYFPHIEKECAEILLQKEVAGIGVDTFSPDLPKSDFPIHKALLGKGKYIIENLANLDSIPETGAFLIAFPPKWQGAAECPLRAVALIPKSI